MLVDNNLANMGAVLHQLLQRLIMAAAKANRIA